MTPPSIYAFLSYMASSSQPMFALMISPTLFVAGIAIAGVFLAALFGIPQLMFRWMIERVRLFGGRRKNPWDD